VNTLRQDTTKYKYRQVDTYKEILELQHIKIKNLVVNIVLLVFAAIVTFFLYRLDMPTRSIYLILFVFGLLFLANIFLYSLQEDLYNNLKLAMYVNTLGVYVIATVLILMFETPSIFTSLFLAYAISSIYQDYKVMIISNTALFVIGLLLAINFSGIFSIPGNTVIQNVFIVIFLSLFVLLLTLSSYILIKRKSFFYNHLAQIKEAEVRNMDLLSEIEHIRTNHKLDTKGYYKDLMRFSDAISKKIGIENVFKRKIELLRDLETSSPQDLLSSYPEYHLDEIVAMKRMELTATSKMRHVAIKASKARDIEVLKKEMFSESQFKSFKHYSDERYVKIIAFVVFYVLLKIDKPYLKEMTEDQIKDVLYNSEYFYLIDADIMELYRNNNEVFDTVVNDILKEVWTHATDR
jgi:hypothetical protein